MVPTRTDSPATALAAAGALEALEGATVAELRLLSEAGAAPAASAAAVAGPAERSVEGLVALVTALGSLWAAALRVDGFNSLLASLADSVKQVGGWLGGWVGTCLTWVTACSSCRKDLHCGLPDLLHGGRGRASSISMHSLLCAERLWVAYLLQCRGGHLKPERGNAIGGGGGRGGGRSLPVVANFMFMLVSLSYVAILPAATAHRTCRQQWSLWPCTRTPRAPLTW